MAAPRRRHDAGALEEVWGWVDPQFGAIRTVSGTYLSPPDPRWWIYTCDLARCPVGTWHSLQDFSAAGCSVDPDEALRRALGEAVERYAGLSALDPGERMLLDPAENELVGWLPLCAADEPCAESFRSWPVGTRLTHYPMRPLAGGAAVPVPAGYVTLGFAPGAEEPWVTLPISTGMAFHPDRCTAIWRGLCEAAERDAMMLSWWTRRPAGEIDGTRGLPETVAGRMERLARAGLEARLFDITTDFRVPTVFCVVRGERYPYLVVGAACHEDPAAACAKALDESVSGRVSLRCDQWAVEVASLESFDWVQRLEHHIFLYAGWRDTPALDFLLNSGAAALPFAEFAGRAWRPRPVDMDGLARVAGELKAEGLDVLWKDLTPADAAYLGFAVKVLVPQMVPLSQDHRARWLNTPRLLRAAGLRTARCADFNPFPHPFA